MCPYVSNKSELFLNRKVKCLIGGKQFKLEIIQVKIIQNSENLSLSFVDMNGKKLEWWFKFDD